MTTRLKSNKVLWKQRGICCHNVSDIIEWFIIIVIMLLAIFSEFPIIKSTHTNTYIPNNTLYSYPNIKSSLNRLMVYSITLLPIYLFFIFNVFTLKITAYYLYHKELTKLRNIEIYKNRNNKPNELRLIDSLFNNKYSSKTVLSYLISLTKSILFSLGLCHLIIIMLNIGINAPKPYYFNSNNSVNNNLNSFPSIFCGDAMSVNCLLFICMLYSLQFIQNKYFSNKKNKFKKYSDYKLFTISSFNNHCFNGNMYFGANIWYILKDTKILSYFTILIPLILTLYIGIIQIKQYKHFIIDVISGYLIGIFTSFLSFQIFKNQLFYETNIMSLSDILTLCIHAKNAQNGTITPGIASPKRFKNRTFSLSNKKKKYPLNPIYCGETSLFPMTFGMNTNDYNLRELEEIALQIGTNCDHSTTIIPGHGNNNYHTLTINNGGDNTEILTDDDGIEIDDDSQHSTNEKSNGEVEDEDDEEDSDEETFDESNSSTETVSMDKEMVKEMDNVANNNKKNNSKKCGELRKNSVTQRKNKLLAKHRKSIKLTLAPPSQNSSKISPLSFNMIDENVDNIIGPFSNMTQSIATTISPLSAPHSRTSYNRYAE